MKTKESWHAELVKYRINRPSAMVGLDDIDAIQRDARAELEDALRGSLVWMRAYGQVKVDAESWKEIQEEADRFERALNPAPEPTNKKAV